MSRKNRNPGNLAHRDKGDRQFTAAQGGMGAKGAAGPDYSYDTAQDEYEGPKVVPDDTSAAVRGQEDFQRATEDASLGSGKQLTDAKSGIGVAATNEEGFSGAQADELYTAGVGVGAGGEQAELRSAQADEREIVRQGQKELKEHPVSTLRSGKEVQL